MDSETLLPSLFDCDVPMTSGSVMEGNTCYRDSMDMDFAAINAFLTEDSPIEALGDTWDVLKSKDASYESSPSSTHCQVEEDYTDSARVDGDSMRAGRSRKRAKTQYRSPKDEVSSLRIQADSLRAKLLSLQYKSARLDSTNDTSGAVVSTQAQQIWRRMALSQLDRRQKAEAENASLREMVALQVLEAKNLRRMLKRRTRIEMMEDMLGVKEMTRIPKPIPDNESSIFQELGQAADALYLRIDSLFGAKGMNALPITGHSREANLDVINGVYYEANLRNTGMPELWFNSCCDSVETNENMLQTSFSVAVSGIEDLVGTYNQMVVRRYKDDKRVVYICRVLAKPRFQNGHPGASVTTTMHIVLEHAEADTTVMKVYFSAERDISPTTVDTTATVAMSAWDVLVPRFAGDVETILLESNKPSRFRGLVTV
ncbi:uncharacterized protein IUM83_01061 [Phytophthora cinnamomi]|uniref:uncharacterized protein n=1 Tax=Phytophthora cinnamomi TaxID=4785 RepID=UPI00355A57B1|nr:hypothetical protein IUM83_01061 [Phytophthora cinnamomi]